VYLEMLKALVMLGIAVKGIGARFWLATATAVATLYFTVGLIAVHVFHKRFPPATTLIAGHPAPLVVAMLVAPVALYALARARRATRPGWREVGDLCLLAAIIEGIQLALLLLVL